MILAVKNLGRSLHTSVFGGEYLSELDPIYRMKGILVILVWKIFGLYSKASFYLSVQRTF
jgi:hypothetical protein